jgi:predicted CXXCH cytochrome family protein
MRSWWAAALAATIAGVGGATEGAHGPRAPVGPGGGAGVATCELSRVDRARTPSTACTGCHAGAVGPGRTFEMAAGGRGMSHPVGVSYAEATAPAPERYAPSSELPGDVPLVDGRIECTTCHDGALTTKNQVVESKRLCLACHRL